MGVTYESFEVLTGIKTEKIRNDFQDETFMVWIQAHD